MGNLFSRNKQPLTTNEDDQFFDCLNDDESPEHHEQNIQIPPQVISHYYAVWVPSTVETTGNRKSIIK